MPKLSNITLAKRFHCQSCGKSLRTRQGLSGHIQWAHKKEDKKLVIKMTPEVLSILKLMENQLGLPNITSEDVADIAIFWDVVVAVSKILDVTFIEQDMKNYLITSLAEVHQYQRLKKDIISSLSGAISW